MRSQPRELDRQTSGRRSIVSPVAVVTTRRRRSTRSTPSRFRTSRTRRASARTISTKAPRAGYATRVSSASGVRVAPRWPLVSGPPTGLRRRRAPHALADPFDADPRRSRAHSLRLYGRRNHPRSPRRSGRRGSPRDAPRPRRPVLRRDHSRTRRPRCGRQRVEVPLKRVRDRRSIRPSTAPRRCLGHRQRVEHERADVGMRRRERVPADVEERAVDLDAAAEPADVGANAPARRRMRQTRRRVPSRSPTGRHR